MSTLITKDRLDELVAYAKKAPEGGYFAEVGVYKGGSLKLLAMSFPERKILGFDTFEGLPSAQWSTIEPHKAGDFSDTSKEAVSELLGDFNKNVELIKGLFPGSAESVKDYKFSFVHVDTDFYLGVKACIEWFWPRLLPGGIIVFDDYEWMACPGVKKALDESGKPFGRTNAQYQAYMIKE